MLYFTRFDVRVAKVIENNYVHNDTHKLRSVKKLPLLTVQLSKHRWRAFDTNEHVNGRS